jgi:hypothetical protein
MGYWCILLYPVIFKRRREVLEILKEVLAMEGMGSGEAWAIG